MIRKRTVLALSIVTLVVLDMISIYNNQSSRAVADTLAVPTLTITRENAIDVAGLAVNTIGRVGRFMFGSIYSVVVNPYSSSSLPDLQLLQLPQFSDCYEQGSVTVESDGEGVTLNSGNQITATFDKCDQGLGIISSGVIELTVQEQIVNRSGPPYSFILTVNWIDYSETEYGDTRTINGQSMLQERTADNIVFDGSISGSSINFSNTAADTVTLNNFVAAKISDTNTYTYQYYSKGSLDSKNLGGSVRYETTIPFVGYSPAPPSSGTMEIIGNNSSEVLTVVDSIELMLEIDENDNSLFDHKISGTWDNL